MPYIEPLFSSANPPAGVGSGASAAAHLGMGFLLLPLRLALLLAALLRHALPALQNLPFGALSAGGGAARGGKSYRGRRSRRWRRSGRLASISTTFRHSS